jgi:3-methyl-2-oxobutanoate hydroxymethyltransferase
MAQQIDQYCDLILVGDSVSMVLYGFENTQAATMEMMIRHGQAVVRASKSVVIIVDMPYNSYETNPAQALKNAQCLMDETGCDGVKLEGGVPLASTISHLVQNDIPVMAHIGLLPQSVTSPADYKIKGKEQLEAKQLIEDAHAVAKAGAFSVVIEAVPESLAATITAEISIPTIGIGASNSCDGQVLVTEDMLGLTLGKKPKFVKEYAALSDDIEEALQSYAKEVRNRTFPNEKYVYKTT